MRRVGTVRLSISRRRPRGTLQPAVVEVVTPRTNAATLSSAENLVAALALAEPFVLEMAADAQQRRLLVRASTPGMRRQLESQLGAAYPQATLRPLEAVDDPACTGPRECAATCILELRAPMYLPIRCFSDMDLDGSRAAQADPILGVLSALGDLPPGWRGLSQLVLHAAAEDWCRDHARYAVQHPLEHERVVPAGVSSAAPLAFLSVVLALAALAVQAMLWARGGQWLQGAALLVAAALLGTAIVLFARRVLRPRVYDMELVREKVARMAYRAELRLSVFAPADVPARDLYGQLDRVAGAYRRYNLAAANGFRPRTVGEPPHGQLVRCDPIGSHRRLSMLTTREIAGLWHLPHAAADVPLLERTTARGWLPMPASVAAGCRIGTSVHQGRAVDVSLPADLLNRHLLLVAKTRRGKSTLLVRLAMHTLCAAPGQGVLLVDPHADLAAHTLGLIPPERTEDVVFLDVANHARPFGLNLLDVGLGWTRDRAVANTLSVFQHEWGDRYWGPRMEDAFRFALMSLFDANLALCAADPINGRAAQHTLLEVPTLLADSAFRRQVLATVADPTIRTWWSAYFEPLDRRLQQEVINPILSKIHRFEGSRAARLIVGQPASTVDPGEWVRAQRVVIVNTARGTIGDNAAGLIGSTLVNLVALAIADQARLAPSDRRRMTIFVDEFHTIPGADYESILSELAKYGANLVLATQSLARLMAPGREDTQSLRALVFANLDGLFAFNCSAEDAEYLAPELGGVIDPQDLLELGEHQCYARISSSGRRLPTFSVCLDPPLPGDPPRARHLAELSAERYGRDAALVEADRLSACARVLQAHAAVTPALEPVALTAEAPAPGRTPRNEHRPRKKRRVVQAVGP